MVKKAEVYRFTLDVDKIKQVLKHRKIITYGRFITWSRGDEGVILPLSATVIKNRNRNNPRHRKYTLYADFGRQVGRYKKYYKCEEVELWG